MSYRSLSTEQMVEISRAWVEGPVHDLLKTDGATSGALVLIQGTHDRMLEVRAADEDVRAREISEELSRLDDRHDALTRGMYEALNAVSVFSTDEHRSQVFLDARQKLFPRGLVINRWTYMEQAGNAAEVAASLSDEVRAILDDTTVGDLTLGAAFDQWQEVSVALADKLAEQKGDARAISANEIQQARYSWIRGVMLFRGMIEASEAFDDAQKGTILGELERALDA